ncbi:unnamed protein product [Rhizophagus irregularis]|uniref:Uncharacterized protein n=1 Tax=Rhizophagus irregularis TaxID=588596 RepID=A0A2N1MLL9_9GLOM|nr:hypothetical protein RhiirC2_790231 [Rhizophagus irregularis]CAB4396565.1 unnamed protein product [Rhizophagus irregularis]
MFIDQIISPDGLFLKTWKEIKHQLKNKRGRTPKWYQYLLNNIILNQNNLRLTFDVPSPNIYNPQVDRPKIIPQSTEIRRIKNTWIAYWCPRLHDVIFGRIVEKSHFYNHHQIIRFEHYKKIPDSHPNFISSTPRSRPTFLTKCTGCQYSDHNTFNSNIYHNCYISVNSNSTFIIHV